VLSTVVINDVPLCMSAMARCPAACCCREAYELFATAAPDHTVKVWDVRSQRCAFMLSGHRNCQLGVGLAFSPCLRYLAAGSESKVGAAVDASNCSLIERYDNDR